jgi:glutathione S-transferase
MLEIYGFLRCPFAWRTRLTAQLKGVPYQWIPTDVSYPDPRVAKNNPKGFSPLALHDGFALTESFNVQQFVDEAFPGPPLQPSDPRARATMRMFVDSLKPLVEISRGGNGREIPRHLFKKMDQLFVAVNQQLQGGGPWLDGQRPGLSDCAFLPIVADLESQELTFSLELGNLVAYWARISAWEPFRATRPFNAEIQGRK